MLRDVLSVVAIALIVAVSAASGQNTTDYEIWCLGNCNTDAQPSGTQAGVVMMGGGTDVTVAFQWMIGRSGGGDFVVLRAYGTDAYNPWIMGLGKLNSCTTILTKVCQWTAIFLRVGLVLPASR